MKSPNHEVAIPNPALKDFSVFIGEWKTVGTHAQIPGTILHGRTSFNWIEGGAFLIMHSEIDEEGIPSGVAVLGSDNTIGEYFMLYFDERAVSRKLNVRFQDDVLTWWRDAPEFSQRYTLTVTDNGNTITGKGEMAKDGKTWEKDLDLTYTRIQ